MTQPAGAQAKVIQAWRTAIQDLEKGRTRRGKATSKLGRITRIVVKDGAIEAKVKGFGGGFGSGVYAVSFPAVDWWVDYAEQVATWLSRRPDWLAALLANEWDESFVTFVHQAGLRLLPAEDYTEALRTRSVCTCAEANMPCQHVLMVIYEIIEQVAANPMRMLVYSGLSVTSLLDEVHRLSVLEQETRPAGIEQALPTNVKAGDASSALFAGWPEERQLLQTAMSVETPSRSIMPQTDSRRLATWRQNHIACDAIDSSS